MPGSGSAGTETAGDGADAPGSEADGTAAGNGEAGGSEPGFGDMAGGADLPSMVDTLPTFDEDYGSEGEGSSDSEGSEKGGEDSTSSGGPARCAERSGKAEGNNDQAGPGTRASGGMESDSGAEGPMTAAEQVAILDRQLEESTRDFDGIIYDEEQRQREAAQRS